MNETTRCTTRVPEILQRDYIVILIVSRKVFTARSFPIVTFFRKGNLFVGELVCWWPCTYDQTKQVWDLGTPGYIRDQTHPSLLPQDRELFIVLNTLRLLSQTVNLKSTALHHAKKTSRHKTSTHYEVGITTRRHTNHESLFFDNSSIRSTAAYRATTRTKK